MDARNEERKSSIEWGKNILCIFEQTAPIPHFYIIMIAIFFSSILEFSLLIHWLMQRTQIDRANGNQLEIKCLFIGFVIFEHIETVR